MRRTLLVLAPLAALARFSPGAGADRGHGRRRARRARPASRSTAGSSSPGSRSPERPATRSTAARRRRRSRPGHARGGVTGTTLHGRDRRERHDVLLRRPRGRRRRRVAATRWSSGHAGAQLLRRATRSCIENCFPGTRPGRASVTTPASGAASRASRPREHQQGRSRVDLKVNADAGSTFRIEIYRSGYYGGDGARLFSTIRGVPACAQPACVARATTGLIDCSNWSVSATITTTRAWPSGVYLLAPRPRGQRRRQPHPVRRPRRRRAVRRSSTACRVHDLPGLQQLRRQVALRLQLDGAEPSPARPRGQGLVRPAVSPAATGQRDWYTQDRLRDSSTGSSSQGYDVAYTVERRPRAQRRRCVRTTSATSRRPRRVLLGRDAQRARAAARDAGVHLFFDRRERRSTGRSASRRARCRAPGPRAGLLQVDAERRRPTRAASRRATWRDPAGRQQAGERAARRRCTSATTTTASSRSGSAPPRARTASGAHGPRRRKRPGTSTNIGTSSSAGSGTRASPTASSPPA